MAAAGAYPAIGAILPMLTQMMSVGVYEVPKVRFDAKTVLTNNTTVGAYRGAGRPEATQLIERVLDVAADQIGIDPAEIRRINFMQPDTFPRTTITGANYDSGEYEKALDAALEASGYAELRAEQAARRASGDTKQLGIGVSTYVEVTAPVGLHVEWGACEVNADGSATVFAGTSVHGQGHQTAFAMLASDVLGIPMDKITLVNSDTARVPRGSGTLGSRSLQTAGSAIHVASEGVLDRAKQIAAHMLEASPDDIVVGDGGLQVAGVPSNAVSWASSPRRRRTRPSCPTVSSRARCATSSTSTAPIRRSRSGPTSRWSRSTPRPVASRCCATSPSTTAAASSTRCSSAASSTAASRRARRRRLYEQVMYDADGNPITSNLMDYAIPSAAELCSFETSNTQTDSPRNPLGAKGIGESGTIGSTPAIQNAVVDAVSHLGVTHIDMPCTAERVWTAINDAR